MATWTGGIPTYRVMVASRGDNDYDVVLELRQHGAPFDVTGYDNLHMILRNEDVDYYEEVPVTEVYDQVTQPGVCRWRLTETQLAHAGNILAQVFYQNGNTELTFPNNGGYGLLAVQETILANP